MDLVQFNHSLPAFNTLLVEHLHSKKPLHIENNYVRSTNGVRFSYTRLVCDGQAIQFTVSYDQFYQVPVLFFRCNDSVACSNKNCIVEMHPTLQSPYLLLHPCESAALMKDVLEGEADGTEYLVVWFGLHFSELFPEIQLRITR